MYVSLTRSLVNPKSLMTQMLNSRTFLGDIGNVEVKVVRHVAEDGEYYEPAQ